LGIRSFVERNADRIVKAFAPGIPPEMRAAEDAAGMLPNMPFTPGEPVAPYDGYSRVPRQYDFVPGFNIATRPRTHEMVSFDTLKGLIRAYDVSQIAIWHRIDSIRSLDWKLIAADGYNGDITGAVQLGLNALDKPDRVHGFKTWFAKWMFDVLAYDAGCLYRMRNRGGRCIGLKVPDGTTIAPLLDYWGDPPADPAVAYVQFANGVPWNWLTRRDLIYEPFRPRNDSPYGHAPLESILVNANTDLRFQLYFLQRFTAGNIPEAFASAPETWNPDQIEQFQEYWDGLMYGDQERKSQIRWMPGGSTITWSNEKDFTDVFSLFLMRKTAAAYHVVPSDLGFTETVNLSSSESQVDVQHRVGDLPLMSYAEDIITHFLYDDLGLPLQFMFDRGEDQDDRLQQAQADDIYIKNSTVSSDEIREIRFGLTRSEQAVPRVFFTERSGPVPLNALFGVAGEIDPQSGAPAAGSPLPHEAFTEVEGVLSNPPVIGAPLAVDEYGPAALPPAPPMQPPAPGSAPVGKEAAAAGATEGITSETGITSYDLDGRRHHADDDEDEARKAEAVTGPGRYITVGEARQRWRESDAARAGVSAEDYLAGLASNADDEDQQVAAEQVRKELAAFHRFERARRKAGAWRDFEFHWVGQVEAHQLNDAGRFAVRKDTGQVAVAGLAVQAADTGRVLMIQRYLDPADPAGGTWEFPGGHIEDGETPMLAAWREWAEETGCVPPPGTQTGSWTSPNGIYQGIVWTVDAESSVPVRSGTEISNPDDPDGDMVEAIAWWSPDQLPGNPAVRPELAACLDDVLAALGTGDGDGDGDGDLDDEVAKAGDGQDPKAGSWPGWKYDLAAAAYWGPLLARALGAALTGDRASRVAGAYLAGHPDEPGQNTGSKTDQVNAAAAWLTAQGVDLAGAVAPLVPGIVTDGYVIGGASATAMVTGQPENLDGWKPGDQDPDGTRTSQIGLGPALDATLAGAGDIAGQIAHGYLIAVARALVDAAASGATAATAGAAVKTALTDAGHAAASALAQLTAVIGQAAMAVYQAHQIRYGRWITEDDGKVCALCLGNEAAGRVPMGDPYPSGDVCEPAHPGCRCAVVPD
jgi:8-oxo-dGTP pyrophosphatase MutT (NUDIX family)